jgi:hypothetical protein
MRNRLVHFPTRLSVPLSILNNTSTYLLGRGNLGLRLNLPAILTVGASGRSTVAVEAGF